jgi:hypothetical protein
MMFRHPREVGALSRSTRSKYFDAHLVVVPEWFALKAVVAALALGALLVELKMVSRTVAGSRAT